MTESPSLTTLAQWLAGEFSNREQALSQPTWFVDLVLWHRPLPQRLDGCVTIFAEQANALYRDQPYRQRLLSLRQTGDRHWVQYFGLKQPGQFRGAGQDPTRLAALTLDDVERLPGCVLNLTLQSDRITGTMADGDRCQFHYDGKIGEVRLGFEARPTEFDSYDRGIDPETGRAIWGALMGPYAFSKVTSFAEELPLV